MKKTWLFAVLAGLFFPLALQAKTTVIYHTSDSHGFYYAKDGRGGFAALAGLLKQEKLPYILLDSGDFANGTVEAKNSKGIKSVLMMNALGYAASTLGNHEFDFKDPGVEPMLRAAQFPILAANFVDRKTGKQPEYLKSYQIFNVDGVKYAVIGLGHEYPTNETQKFKILKSSKVLDKVLAEVEAQNPDVIVLVDHNSIADDKHGRESTLLKMVTKHNGKINVVLGGHAHKIIQNAVHNGTLFVESGCYLKNVSRITVETDDKTGKFVSATSQIIPLYTQKTGEYAPVAALANALMEPGMDKVLGSASVKLSRMPVKGNQGDSPLNNWVADVCRAYSGADVFIHNNGGTRVDLEQGTITKRDLVNMHPFGNKISQVKVSGKFLEKFVKYGLAPRNLFSYSGLQIEYKLRKGKVQDLKIWVNGQALDKNKTYVVATNTYIAEGGSEGWPFKQIPAADKKQVGDLSIQEIMEKAIETTSPLGAVETGRIIIK